MEDQGQELERIGAPAAPDPDPTAHTDRVPRNVPSNDNPNVGSVGAGVPAGFGDVHAIWPRGGWHSTAWQGWPVDWATPFFRPMSGGPGAIQPANSWTGLQFDEWLSSVVWACVDLNARALATMDPVVTRTQVVGAQRVQVPEYDDVPAWLVNPHPVGEVYTSWNDFMQALAVAVSIQGEAFVVADTFLANGWPASFFVANPYAVDIVDDLETGGHAYRWTKTGKRIESVCHIRYMTIAADVHGHGPLEGVTRALSVVRGLENYAAKLVANGGIPWGVLRPKVNLGNGGAQRLQADWVAAAHRRDGAPAVLDGDTELDTLTINPKDMAMLDLLTYYGQRVCAAFGVPPFLVGMPSPEGLTYANANSLFDFHYRATLQGLSQNFMTALSGFLVPRGRNVALLPDKYTQPDLLIRTQANQMMNAAGALTINEWRAREGLPPLGDVAAAAGVPVPPVPSAAELEGMVLA